ncbi:MAG: DNA-directed RNA polymerase subunit L [Candidatus Bathyarchaeota archaeon]|nr:DNA-directed RNA polymerase subunit L [Candidatus Bathyarchaeota archaeon]MCX8176800.1 DNA-directed RNA polymerase subunit L [Candidatus Bathyarchaeota archaeon]MDW8193329.1 DNA-directed RNA polymerase subunit L [Nitrososphaerota archaeon]
MKIKVLKRTENELKIEVEGAGHTLCNLLQKKLLENENVDVAGYDIPHPLTSNPIIYVRTKSPLKPEDALLDAVERAKEMNKEFGEALKRLLQA